MKLDFDRSVEDEFVRITVNDITMIAISAKSIIYPGLWMNRNISDMKIIGVDLLW